MRAAMWRAAVIRASMKHGQQSRAHAIDEAWPPPAMRAAARLRLSRSASRRPASRKASAVPRPRTTWRQVFRQPAPLRVSAPYSAAGSRFERVAEARSDATLSCLGDRNAARETRRQLRRQGRGERAADPPNGVPPASCSRAWRVRRRRGPHDRHSAGAAHAAAASLDRAFRIADSLFPFPNRPVGARPRARLLRD